MASVVAGICVSAEAHECNGWVVCIYLFILRLGVYYVAEHTRMGVKELLLELNFPTFQVVMCHNCYGFRSLACF